MGPQNETIQHTSTVFLCGVICSLGEGIAIVHPGSVWLGLSRAVAVLYKRSIKILWKEQVAACGITATMKARKVLNHTRLFAKLNRLQKTTTSAVRKLRLPPLYLCFLQYFGEFIGGGFVHVIRHLLVAHEDELELCTPCESCSRIRVCCFCPINKTPAAIMVWVGKNERSSLISGLKMNCFPCSFPANSAKECKRNVQEPKQRNSIWFKDSSWLFNESLHVWGFFYPQVPSHAWFVVPPRNPWVSCLLIWILVASHTIDFFARMKGIREGAGDWPWLAYPGLFALWKSMENQWTSPYFRYSWWIDHFP